MPRVTDTVPAMVPRWGAYVRLDQLRPAVRNPKKHCLPDIIESMIRFGFTNPILVCSRTDRIAGGHGRLAALILMREQGDRMPEGLILDEDGEWCVPVSRGWASRNDTELEAYIIADNKLTENGGWDSKLTAEMLHDIHSVDPTLFEAVGFTADEMDDLFAQVDPERWDKDPESVVADDDAEPSRRPPTKEVCCPHCGETFDPTEVQ